MARAHYTSRMDLNKTAVGNQTEDTAKVFYTSLKGTYTRAPLQMTRRLATVYYTPQIHLDKTVIGDKIGSTARAFYTGQMEADKRESLRTTSSVDWEPYTNQMGQDKRAIGGSTRGMDMVWNKPQRERGRLSFGRMVFLLNDLIFTVIYCSLIISHCFHKILKLYLDFFHIKCHSLLTHFNSLLISVI